MADKDEVVELEDEGVVTVDVSDNPELAEVEGVAAPAAAAPPAAEPPKKSVPRKQLSAAAVVAVTGEDATKAAIAEAVKASEAARVAAEATANSERQRAEQAALALQQQRQQNEALKSEVEDRELAILNGGIESATREVTAYEAELKTALEAGDFAKVSTTQVKLSKATAALDRLEAAKVDYEGRKAAATTEGRVEAPPAPAAPTFENYVRDFSPRAQAWLRAHPECAPAQVGGSIQANAKMMAGHWAALGAGVVEGSDDYFRVIEEHTGHRQKAAPTPPPAAEEAGVTDDPPPKKSVRQAQPSAPPSREPPAAPGSVRTTRSVTLTKEQQEAARISFPNMEPKAAFALYARNLLELESEGKMGRLTH